MAIAYESERGHSRRAEESGGRGYKPTGGGTAFKIGERTALDLSLSG